MNQLSQIKVFNEDGRLYRGQIACPTCHELQTVVRETRGRFHADRIVRRRSCAACGYRFTTVEKIDQDINIPTALERIARAEKSLTWTLKMLAELAQVLRDKP